MSILLTSLWLMSLAFLSSFLGATVEGVGVIDFAVFVFSACLILTIQSGLLFISNRFIVWTGLVNQGKGNIGANTVTVAGYLIAISITWYLAFVLRLGYLPSTGVLEKHLPIVLYCYLLGFLLLPIVARSMPRSAVRYIIDIVGITFSQGVLAAILLFVVIGFEDIPRSIFIIQFTLVLFINLLFKRLTNLDLALLDPSNPLDKNGTLISISPSAALCLFFIILNGYFFTNTTIDLSARIGISAIQLFFATCFLLGYGSRSIRKVGTIVSVVFLLAGLGQFSFFHVTSQLDSIRTASRQPWSELQITDSRNLYVLFFDSLVNRRALEETFRFYEFSYLDKLVSLGFREIRGVVSASDDSNPTFVRVLTGHDAIDASWAGGKYISGYYDTPIYELLKRNNIRIQVLMPGRDHGENSDRLDYFFPDARGIRSCDRAARQFIYGLCSQRAAFLLDEFFGLTSAATPFELVSRTVERVVQINNSSSQWLTLAYIWLPGHGDRLADPYYAESFKQGFRTQIPLVTREIEKIIGVIKDADPDPIILIAGDHGSLIFNEGIVGKVNEEAGRPYDLTDVILDHWGVALSVFPKNFCQEQLDDEMTTLNLFPKVLLCMSNSTTKFGSWSQGIPVDTKAAMENLNESVIHE